VTLAVRAQVTSVTSHGCVDNNCIVIIAKTANDPMMNPESASHDAKIWRFEAFEKKISVQNNRVADKIWLLNKSFAPPVTMVKPKPTSIRPTRNAPLTCFERVMFSAEKAGFAIVTTSLLFDCSSSNRRDDPKSSAYAC
jgi:hypothetical protein